MSAAGIRFTDTPDSGLLWLREWLLLACGVLLATTILQRFAIPGSGGLLGLGFVVALGVWFLALLRGQLTVDPARLVLYVLALGSLMVTFAARWEPFSLFSFVMLALLYLPFISMRMCSVYDYRLMLEIFQRIMILSAILGLLQIAIQFPLGPAWMFPFDMVLPASFFIDGFNLQIPIVENYPYLKSTGLWFLEPSHLSQLLALAIVIEVSYFRRVGVLALFGIAYLSSFSGTGALLLFAVGLPMILRLRQYWMFVPIIGFFLLLPFLHDVWPFSYFIGRLEELNNPLASGSMRFLAPYWLVGDALLGHPKALLFGYGPGSIEDVVALKDYAVQDTAWLKLLVEYGLVGCGGFFVFYLTVLFRHSPDRLLSFACLIQFLFLGGYLNAFYVQFLHMVLVAWPRLAPIPTVTSGASGSALYSRP